MAYVELDSIKKIEKKLHLEYGGEVQAFFTNTCKKHCDKYVPFDSGALANTIDVQPTYFTYQTPYASYQYYGERQDGTHQIDEANRNRNRHPLASSYWDKKMVSAEMSDVVSEVKDYMKGRNL